jgi:hypothetical protein
VRVLELIATIIWAGNVFFGLYPLFAWQLQEGLRSQPARITQFPSAVVLAHPVLGAAGLLLWAVFLYDHSVRYAWASFAVLSTSALLGFVTLTRWLEGRGGRHARGPNRRFPVRAIFLHGAFGLTTFTLVLITATLAMQQHPH